MLDAIRDFFHRAMVPADAGRASASGRDVRLAACALLLELAHADDDFGPEERVHLAAAVERHFEVAGSEAEELLALAERERAEAMDLFQFTRLINQTYSPGQKMVLVEAMWGLVYADGAIGDREDVLIRRITELLDLKPGYLAEARRRARGEGPREG